MKNQKRNVLLVLATSFLLIGCANGKGQAEPNRRPLLAGTADDSFTVTTNLEEVKEIHTAQQKAYLTYDGSYLTIPEASYPDGQQHISDPEPVNLAWDFTAPSGKTVSRFDVKIGKEADLKDGYVVKGTNANSLDIYNSYLGDNYFQIIANYSDGTSDTSAIQKYKVDESYPRNLKIDGMTNCRDMGGGRQLEDGGYIKQGLLYRTSSTNGWGNGRAKVPDTITNDGKEELLTHLGCKTEINVNNGGNTNYINIDNFVIANMWYDGGKHHLYRNAEPVKEVFHALANPENYPIFYHCRIGTDRTGLCAILISGLLGVSENEIYQDYLFSNFGNIQEKRYIGDKAGRDNILNYINDLKAFPGEKFQNKIYNYLLSIGVPAAELNSVIDILTEGNKASGNDNYQEYVRADDFSDSDGTTLKDNKNDRTARANPVYYYTLGQDQSVTAYFEAKYTGSAKLIAYLGSTDSSSSKTIKDSLMVTYDGNEIDVAETTFAEAGFGSGDGRTYYTAVVLGDVEVIEGGTEVVITGLATNLNIGSISVISEDKVIPGSNPGEQGDDSSSMAPVSSSEESSSPAVSSETPAPSSESGSEEPVMKSGCGGSIVATTSLIALVAIAGASFFALRRKEDK